MPTNNSNTTSVEVNKYPTEKRAQQFRHDPALLGITKLNIFSEAKSLKRSAKSSRSNDIPERSTQYVEPTSIQSMFSPGRYLCELYNVAKELHKEGEPLHIDQRRPDLKELQLNQESMEQEVSTLDILLETLKTKSSLSELAIYNGESDDGSFTLPYDDNLTIINTVLESKSTSLRNIATLLADTTDVLAVKLTPALVQEQLGLNPASYELIKSELAKGDSSPRLAHATKLTVEQLSTLVTSIQSRGHLNQEQVLAVLSEYVRLNHQYGVPVDQFIAIFGKRDTKEATADIKNNRMATISQLFGMNFSQAEILLTLCGHPEALQDAAEGDAPHILAIFGLFENIVQWMSEQKLDLSTLQAMLTGKYSATATPELFNFLSNIYHSVDKAADEKLLKQNLCRSLAAGFHLKTEVVAGLVSWLESNDKEFTAQKLNQAIIEVFSNNPTLEKLEHHPQLVNQCQKLSQYVLIAQWAKLTQQDITLLLQPKLINGNEKPLRPSLSLLRLLAEFKAWQQQVKVPVSEALQYFSLFTTDLEVNRLEAEHNKFEKQLAEEDKERATERAQYDSLIFDINILESLLIDSRYNIKILNRNIESNNIEISQHDIKLKELINENNKPSEISKERQIIRVLTEKNSNIVLNLEKIRASEKEMTMKMHEDKKSLGEFYKKTEELKEKIKNNKKEIDKIKLPQINMLSKIHGWDYQQTHEMNENISPGQLPIKFTAVYKLSKHINMATKIKVITNNLLNLKSLALGSDNKESIIKATGESFITSL